MRRLVATSILFALVGCSFFSSPPSQADIDFGVKWALSRIITREVMGVSLGNIYSSYKITNQYTETRGDAVAYVYDFEAVCKVGHAFQPTEYWYRDPNGQDVSFTGTFTLTKKGNSWYAQDTVR